ncbi:hypothetical protein DERF_014908 [Dermatophagoides farinae]|uniref:Uncharacterized protein n=1 Tax=Dermatophagoides farinae TaxID=6954 RepID=A0A922L1Q5_DERFA|nr:hypothetical protein DERF_014908 [Dermatophagoides farinae]
MNSMKNSCNKKSSSTSLITVMVIISMIISQLFNHQSDAFITRFNRDHKIYYKAGGGYPVIGLNYWKQRIKWIMTGTFDQSIKSMNNNKKSKS